MNAPVFVATPGQRPEAITMALDVLHPRYHYTDICIVHTHPVLAGIADAYQHFDLLIEDNRKRQALI